MKGKKFLWPFALCQSYKFLNSPILSSSDLGLWPNFSSVTKAKHEVYCSVLQIPSVMVLSNLELQEHKSCAARDDKERLDCKTRNATKTCFLLAHSFQLQKTNSVTQAMLFWDGSCVTRPACNYSDDEIFHILISCANKRELQCGIPQTHIIRDQLQEFHTAVHRLSF